jgi:hypothetical protein
MLEMPNDHTAQPLSSPLPRCNRSPRRPCQAPNQRGFLACGSGDGRGGLPVLLDLGARQRGAPVAQQRRPASPGNGVDPWRGVCLHLKQPLRWVSTGSNFSEQQLALIADEECLCTCHWLARIRVLRRIVRPVTPLFSVRPSNNEPISLFESGF